MTTWISILIYLISIWINFNFKLMYSMLQPIYEMQFKNSYLLGLNELVGLAYVQNLGLLMKRAPGQDFWHKMKCYHSKLISYSNSLDIYRIFNCQLRKLDTTVTLIYRIRIGWTGINILNDLIWLTTVNASVFMTIFVLHDGWTVSVTI